jgi:hypothetical protein
MILAIEQKCEKHMMFCGVYCLFLCGVINGDALMIELVVVNKMCVTIKFQV